MTGFFPFLGIWVAMMAAMMAPSVYPALRLFAVARESRRSFGIAPAPVWLFGAGYLAVWTAFGVPAYALLHSAPMGMFPPRAQGAAVIIAGLYQLTRWKAACLTHCRSPLEFLMHAWRDGRTGAVVMGAHHGAYCVGCCWGLMLVLLAVGAMNLLWMAAVAGVIFVEKIVPHGPVVGRALGGGMVAAGLWLLL